MSSQMTHFGLDELMTAIGEAGYHMSEIDASEGAAGNISVYIGWPTEPHPEFALVETIDLPTPAPELVGKSFLVTGSGCRLREIIQDPPANLGHVVVDEGGHTGRLHTSPRRLFERVTSEFNSHLAVHLDQSRRNGCDFHALLHAHPLHLTYLSHIRRYQDERFLNQRLLRWQPELIIQLPEGLGYLPFRVPGSPELMAATVEALRAHRVVVWNKHGAVARSAQSVKQAADRIEYAETGARYEYMDMVNGGVGDGLTDEEIRAVCRAFGIQQNLF